jgi:hypothetical protein
MNTIDSTCTPPSRTALTRGRGGAMAPRSAGVLSITTTTTWPRGAGHGRGPGGGWAEIIPGIESAPTTAISRSTSGYYVDVTVPPGRGEAASRAAGSTVPERWWPAWAIWGWRCHGARRGALRRRHCGAVHLAQACRRRLRGDGERGLRPLLADDRPGFVPRPNMAPAEALDLIRGAGGIPVLAHPWAVTHLVAPLVEQGLQG